MKKIISAVLVFVMLFSCTASAFAADTGTPEADSPVIYIKGDSEKIYYDNDSQQFSISSAAKILGSGGKENIISSVSNILYPFIVEGIVFGSWDNYYEAVYKELSEAYDPVMLTKDGEPKEGTGISSEQRADNEAAMQTDRKNSRGKYDENAYVFHYDWRLDPIGEADKLNEYIEGVKKATGHSKVSISAKCLGCDVVLAYVNKYSSASLKGVAFSGSTSLGSEFISAAVSGNFGIDGNSISRFITNLSEKDNVYTEIIRPVSAIIDFLDNTGVLDPFSEEVREEFYSKIEYGIISAIALSTLLTYPGYWAIISEEDFENALLYVFGPEGGEKREEYKGLIEKITVYNETIKKNIPSIMLSLRDSDTNVCIISKYGTQMIPMIKGGTTYTGDEYVSVNHSSFGATASDIYSTLGEEYIAQRITEGCGKYISPDKMIDASTCMFPDCTWFIKGCPHGKYGAAEHALIMDVIDADRQLTVFEYELPQYLVFDFDTKITSPMTEENCHTEYFEANDRIDHPSTPQEMLSSFFSGIFRMFKALFELLFGLFTKNAPKNITV